jgi:hypothetical protein
MISFKVTLNGQNRPAYDSPLTAPSQASKSRLESTQDIHFLFDKFPRFCPTKNSLYASDPVMEFDPVPPRFVLTVPLL